MTPAERRRQLTAYADHYRGKAAEPYVVTGDRDPRNPWTGLARAAERALARIPTTPEEAPCERSNATSDGDQMHLDLG